MTAESDKSVTANRLHKVTWERFFPEALALNPVRSLVNLKTYWGSYLSTYADGTLKANAAAVSELTQWLSFLFYHHSTKIIKLFYNFNKYRNFVLRAVDATSNRNVYCIKNLKTGNFISAQNDNLHQAVCNQNSCGSL